MKRKQRLLSRILLPAIVVLLLFPPLSCWIFGRAASDYAYAKANEELDGLQQTVLPLMESSFVKSADSMESGEAGLPPVSDEKTAEYFESHGVTAPAEIRSFLAKVGSLAHRMGGDAHIMILGGEMQVIYPREQEEKDAVAPLAADFVQHLQTAELPEADRAAEWNATDGETYLVHIYQIPTKSVQLKYLITYCSTSRISGWVHAASLLVLRVSSVFVLLMAAVLWFTARSVTKPIGRLCQAAGRIGGGSFETIEPDFSLRELEALRRAMNQMSDRLQHADEAQKSFFQNVSHELRNPLMSIGGYAQGIEQGVFRQPEQAAHTIMEESARLTDLVNSLLTLSRMENDPQKPTLGPVRLTDCIEDCIDRLQGLAIKNSVSLMLLPVEPELTAWCEENLFCQVLDNLLTNAIRYAKSTVSISAERQQNRIQIVVADDGEGIAEQDLPHIFERCYKGNGGNFGIGLAIAAAAAQKLAGTLTADNQAGGGARFVLSLQANKPTHRS